MIRKTITYPDLDGNVLTEDFYFNLNTAEITEWMLEFPDDDLGEHLKKIAASNDAKKLMPLFKDILQRSVGQRSDNGKRFIKSPEITADFMQSNAYEELFMQLLSDANDAIEFITGIVPANLEKRLHHASGRTVEDVQLPTKPHEYSVSEMLAMSDTEFDGLIGTDPKKMTKEQLQVAFRRRNRTAAA